MGKRKLIASIFVGVIALSTISISASLAWYLSSDNTYVDDIIVRLDTDKEILVSSSNEEGSFVPDLDLTDHQLLYPVSSMFASNWLNVEGNDKPLMYEYTNTLTGIDGKPSIEKMNEGFLQQELYFTSLSGRGIVSLDTTIKDGVAPYKFIADTAKNSLRAQTLVKERDEYYAREEDEEKIPSMYRDIKGLTVEQVTERLDNLIKSVRVSFLYQELDSNEYSYLIIDPFKDKEVLFGGRLDIDKDHCYDFYEIKQGDSIIRKEILYGEINEEARPSLIYNDPVNDYIPKQEGDYTSFNARSEKNVYTLDTNKSMQEAGLEIKKENSLSLEEVEDKFEFPVYENKSTRVVMTIYLEGWDLDCVNSTMGASIKTEMSFKLSRIF